MADTTKSLSMDEMLDILRSQAAGIRIFEGRARSKAAGWRKAGDPFQDLASQQDAIADRNAEAATAFEQAIAILETLSHPQFEGINHYWEACKPLFFRAVLLDAENYHHCHSGATVLEAILRAHEAIKASAPAPAPSGED